MGQKSLKTWFFIAVLAMACGAIIWHVFSWHLTGKYDEMQAWLTGGKAPLTVLYNVGLLLVFGLLLGLLTSRFVEAIAGRDQSRDQNKK